ncbi:serine/threonine-protein kinase grp isoform X2 [Phlebotomus papatasi]|nr:serine/threonine-protein kinase grp isoform X2 [Phlebotomus papatasi]XP_055709979.1 serine/threonine-protein kinase grp isoform X2 [Phlebotomus papatasi]XP_055709981.1 serine/threonine-protein kinase grp isoform X2 [Phlebotomus papatasi]
MKMVNLDKHPDAAVSVKKEVCIQKILQNPHILRYYGKRSQGSIEYIFLEYAAGGELFDRIEPDVGMAQNEAQRYFMQLMSGVKYLHDRGVAHRDLKPENILLDERDNIKISDFGMATMFRMKGRERLLDKRCGTLPYVAPEVLVQPYAATPADIWSCGIILVTLLAGELPWDKPTTSCKDFLMWKENTTWTSITPWKKLSTLQLSLLRKILAIQPNERLTIQQILDHKWCNLRFSSTDDPLADDPLQQARKRLRSDLDISGDREISGKMIYLTQPSERSADTTDAVETRNSGFCFSQPTLLDDLILCSQMNPTQGTQSSQSIMQRLVKRMTRFFVVSRYDETIKRISAAADKLGYTWRGSEGGTMTVSTMDRRKLQLIFKVTLIEMDGRLLVDFRLSKGCGLEFKRSFIKIKNHLKDILDSQ